ncbi:MAG TPA: hypothetical protein P5228_02210 [Bacteroidales bacterium]|nr:hypothetical protein [Bacteroidales bacterium]HRZ49140.1 hypothetical protein [Bacteroidales bacterium]
MKRLFLFFTCIISILGVSGQTPVGTGQTYATLKAAFDAINSGTLTGAVVLQLTSNTTEPASAVLNASGGSSNYTSVTIYPAVANLTVSGTVAGALIELSGADQVILDGRVNQQGAASLSISNASTATNATTILFSNDATFNTIKHSIISGCAPTSGVVTFGTTTGSTGNDNNTVEFCEIKDGLTKPRYLVYGSGTTSKENSNNSILNCNLMNYNAATSTGAIYLASGNTGWILSGNSIYQTAAYAGSATTAYGIYISGGNGYQVTNNYIGGSSPMCGGTAWTINGTAAAMKFNGIYLGVETLVTTSVQNNQIRNIYWLTSATTTASPGVWCGIHSPSGNVHIGSSAGNIIGDSVGNGSITIVTTGTTNAYIYGISNISTGSNINISNNRIGSLTLGNGISTTALSALYCIHNSGGTAGTTTAVIENNLIGSLTTPNSILYANATTSTINQFINGLYNNALGSALISGNTVSNIKNNYSSNGTSASAICGLFVGGGSNTITGNVIRDLTSSGTSTGTGIGTNLLGIFFRDIAALSGNQTISGNKVFNLNNTAASAAVTVAGIYFDAYNSASSNVIEKNQVYNLNPSTTGAAVISGINIASSGNTTQVINNMVSLGDGLSNNYLITGILDSAGTNHYYYNSVYIGGSAVSGSNVTYAFNSHVTTVSRNFLNNIFYNGRSNGTGTGKHYAVRIAGTITNPVGLTMNYNDLFTDGTGGVMGVFNSADRTSLTLWQTATGQDANSISADPKYLGITNLHIQTTITSPVDNAGLTVAGITTDFDGDFRTNTPDIGADEFASLPVNNCTGTPSASLILGPDSLCAGNATTLSLNNAYNLTGISYLWKYGTTASGPWTNLDTLLTQSTGILTATRYFTCTISCSFSGLSYTTPAKSIVVTPIPNASISYPGAPFCQADSSIKSVTLTGTTGGTFTALPSGLVLNGANGNLQPSASQPGSYTISYTIPASGGCPLFTATAPVTINPIPNASISYPGSPFCNSLSSIQNVSITGTGGGTFSAAPAGLILNNSTGGITPGSSTPGNYQITYSIAASGGCPPFTTTAPVVVTALPSATISYSSTIFCKNLSTPQSVTLTGTPGGVFSSTTGLSIQPGTGAIVPSTSSMGVYTVNYVIAAGGGCPAVTASTSVFINPMPDPAGVITSVNNDTVNPGEMNLNYTVPAITNATSYIWRYSGSGVTFVPDTITMSAVC